MFIKERTMKTQTINRKNETELDVKLQLGTGKLDLHDGTMEIMEGRFTVYGESPEPEIVYDISESGIGKLVVPQKSITTWSMEKAKQEWEIALNGDLPLALKVELGAGKSKLGLSKLNLMDLHIESGVGETEIDLTGEWKNSFRVKIDAGVGKMKIRVPKHTGMKVDVDKGIGKVKADHFIVVGDSYQNQSYETAEVKIDIDLDVGVGEVILEQA
ncbi:toast rack family protein [Bacillus sp. Marseille-Q3570]|uniref:toast rack family protein n=1 Tax=Bacillus sp. Marseille-Q3570 TaxID=2963522 RepID=UPI0021B834CD|nr:toast rack family protein [Bacillus sp. Marseille-Q3570]